MRHPHTRPCSSTTAPCPPPWEHARGNVHTNSIESLWSTFKRAHKGTFQKMSPKHFDRYVQEFPGRHNTREQDAADQLAAIRDGMVSERLTCRARISDNGLSSKART